MLGSQPWWPPAAGRVIRRGWSTQAASIDAGVNVLFLPQKGYCTEGPLIDQVTYPSILPDSTGEGALTEEEKAEAERRVLLALRQVRLGYLVTRWGLHHACRWDGLLSGGELQRLGFARLL